MPTTTLSNDYETFDFGVWQVNNNVWNKGDRVNGVDYTQSVTFDTDNVPNGITFNWNWGVSQGIVNAYPEIAAGYHPWGANGPTQLTARVDEVKNFTVDFDLDIAGDTSQFNVAMEFWLTSKGEGGRDDITTEVMVWLHNGDLANGSEFSFAYADGGYSANGVSRPDFNAVGEGGNWNYVALAATTDYLSGTIDLHDILVELQRLGLVKATDYISGFELGAEVTGGEGSLTVNSLSYDFGTYSITEYADRINGGDKADNIWGRGGSDTIRAAGGDDVIYGETGNDGLWGDIGNDKLYGGAGVDRLYGGVGDDRLAGDAGADKLYGNAGKDTMTGGDGADRFVFDSAGWATQAGPDLITDFSVSGDDIIDLSPIDAVSATKAVNDAFSFVGEAAFTASGQARVVQIGADTFVELNTGGSLAADFRIQLTGNLALTAGDFIL